MAIRLSGQSPNSNENDRHETVNKFMHYRDEIKHEFDLITGRLNAYLSAQSFLVLAYAAAMNTTNGKSQKHFPLIFSFLLVVIGILLSAQAIAGISAADDTVKHWNAKIRAPIIQNPWLDEYQSGRMHTNKRTKDGKDIDVAHEKGLYFPRYSPWIFGSAWIFFGILAWKLQQF